MSLFGGNSKQQFILLVYGLIDMLMRKKIASIIKAFCWDMIFEFKTLKY